MAEPAHRLMTEDEFLLWCLDQEERYELENGVPIEMMTGASSRHDRLVINVIVALGNQLRGTRCTPSTADIALRTRLRFIRRPDVMVICDKPRPDVYEANEARMVVEVLSPSNRGIRWQRKLDEYRQRAGLNYILLVESERVGARLLARESDEAPWQDADAEDLDGIVDLPAIGCRLPLAEVYDGVVFDDV